MAKQKKRLKDDYVKVLIGLDSIIINLVEVEQKGKKVKMPMASISGSNLDAQVDFGEKVVIKTTTEDGKNVYYKLRPTIDSGITIPREEGYYSLEDADLWVDTQPENIDKHIIRVKSGRFVLTGKFKAKDDMPF